MSDAQLRRGAAMRSEFTTMIYAEVERRSAEYIALRERLRAVGDELVHARDSLLNAIQEGEISRRRVKAFGADE